MARTYKRKRYTKREKAAYYAKKRLRRKFYSATDPDLKSFRRNAFGPSRYQRAAGEGTANRDQMDMRRALNYYGDGKYDWGRLGRNIGKWGSRVAGAGLGALAAMESGPLGMIPAGAEGWAAGADFSKAQGWGQYDLRGSNDLVSSGSYGKGSAPIYHSAGAIDETGDVLISNRELVTLIKSSGVVGQYKEETFTLNPADSVFHHLKTQSKNYEQFEFMGLMFQYVPMTGEGGSNQLGIVGMAASYDPAHSRSFDDIEDLMRFKGSTTCKPSHGMAFGIECDPNKRPIKTMYVRDNVTRESSFTDPATLYIASEGCAAANQTLGQLWVTYSVRLKNIKPDEPISERSFHSIIRLDNTSAYAQTHLTTEGHITAKHDSSTGADHILYSVTNAIVNQKYIVTATWDAQVVAGTLLLNPDLGTPAGCTTVNNVWHHTGAADTHFRALDQTNEGEAACYRIVNCTNPTMNFSLGTTGGTALLSGTHTTINFIVVPFF